MCSLDQCTVLQVHLMCVLILCVYKSAVHTCIIMTNMFVFCRNLVSASQDGKLIVWDGYTTNKVLTWQNSVLFQ